MRTDAEHERMLGDAPALDDVPAVGTASPPKSRRKRRTAENRPDLKPWLRPYVDEARERHKKRHPSPGVAIERRPDGNGYRFTSPHRDLEAWEVQLCDALGTRSGSLYQTFVQQLAGLVGEHWVEDEGKANGQWVPNERELNAAVAIVAGIRPRNEMEAALAAQMVAVHLMQMKVSREAMRVHGYTDPRAASVAGKLARTYAMQMDALNKSRGKTGKQKITVKYERHEHKHVHMHRDGADPGDRGVVDLEGQPVATRSDQYAQARGVRQLAGPFPTDVSPAREHGVGAEVRSEDTFGRVVPLRGREGQG